MRDLNPLARIVEHAFEEPEAEYYCDVHETFGNRLLFVEPGAIADGGEEDESVEESGSWIQARPHAVVDLSEVA